GANEEAGPLRRDDALDRRLEHALALDGLVVRLFQAVEVDVEEEAAVGRKLVQALRDEHAVGAEVDVLAALEDAFDGGADLGVDHRLAAADADDGGAGLVDGGEALGEGELFLDGLRVFADAAAAGAGEVAGVQRLQHQHQREALLALDRLARHVRRHVRRQAERETHDSSPWKWTRRTEVARSGAALPHRSSAPAGRQNVARGESPWSATVPNE